LICIRNDKTAASAITYENLEVKIQHGRAGRLSKKYSAHSRQPHNQRHVQSGEKDNFRKLIYFYEFKYLKGLKKFKEKRLFQYNSEFRLLFHIIIFFITKEEQQRPVRKRGH